jgi:hypothetical protein
MGRIARLLNSRSAQRQSGTRESLSQNSRGVLLRDEYDCFWRLGAVIVVVILALLLALLRNLVFFSDFGTSASVVEASWL